MAVTTQQLSDLKNLLPQLSTSDQAFAISLMASHAKYGKLTPKQEPWIGKLIAKATNPKPAPVKVNVGGFAGVVALFQTAKQHLKFPKVVLLCNGQPVWLALCGPKSKAPGSINVMGEGKYPNRPWFGRVSPEGEWSPSKSVQENPEFLAALQALLVKFGENPARVAKDYGKLTGNCCFCHLALTDPRSTAAGFGPVCAAHYGLTAQWKKAADAVDPAFQPGPAPMPPVVKCVLCGEMATTFVDEQPVCGDCHAVMEAQ